MCCQHANLMDGGVGGEDGRQVFFYKRWMDGRIFTWPGLVTIVKAQ